MKKKLPSILVAAALFATSLPALAGIIVFTASLSGAGEPIPTSTATGNATVSFNDATNAVSVSLSFSGLANNQAFGHIHCCTAAAGTGNASVALGFNPLPAATTGTYSDTFTLSAASFSSLLNGAGGSKAYVNIHTPGTYAGGEIRGFLVQQSGSVPLPSGLALVLPGLLLMGASTRLGRKAVTNLS
jgi:hypothetical protein